MEKKLFLLDGMALVYRAYFAFSQNPRVTSYGFNTSAIFGYTNTVLDLIKKEKPTHIGVAFDTAAPTARHEEYEHYKAHRQEQPEDITKSIPYIINITHALNIPIITLDGYEADDIIGTLSKKAAAKGYTVYMVTPDKDFAQLVEPNILIYKPARMGNDIEIMGVEEVLKKWEVDRVEQVIDILGLWGDAVDNIPGVPGIGEKTAKALVKKYGSIEGLLENTHELKGKQKENIENNKEQALLSKRLATIDINVPIQLEEDKLLLEPPNKDATEKIFNELEFKTLTKRLFANNDEANNNTSVNTPLTFDLFNQGSMTASIQPTESNELKNITNTPHQYYLVQTKEQMLDLLNKLLNQKEVCFDTETSALESTEADIVGLSFSFKAHEAYYIPFSDDYNLCKETLQIFKPVFEHEQITKIGQNIKYDLNILKHYGITLKGPLFDTMLAHYLIDPDLRHNMDYLSSIYLKYEPVSIETLIGKKGKNQLSMRSVELEKIKEYAAEDADITYQLKQRLERELMEKQAEKLFNDVEIPLIDVLSDMEIEGVSIDKNFLNDYSIELDKEIKTLEKDIYSLAGLQFNIASPKQLGEVLFDHLKLDPKAKKTKTGQYQTGEDVLQKLSEHEIVRHILEIRQLQKIKSTYVDSLPQLINPRTGRVHTNFNQAVAATGRLSSTNPNLQNIPIRTDKGKEIRKAFVPKSNDYQILSADYSQIELRIIASLANETAMIDAFKHNLDIHAATAARVYNKDITQVTSTERRNAKAVNFGIIYGQSAFGLSQSLGISRTEAAAIIDEYFKQYPAIKTYMDSTIQFARENGYVKTILGRRRYLRDINSANFTVRGFAERNAINAPIQGSAADMIKVAMIFIHNALKQNQHIKYSKMILQVHDELLFDAHKNEIDELKQLVIYNMERAMPLNVPVKAEVGIGSNWLEAH
ncbi:MAG: DNA polymerase I [Bacteroidia bacterium]